MGPPLSVIGVIGHLCIGMGIHWVRILVKKYVAILGIFHMDGFNSKDADVPDPFLFSQGWTGGVWSVTVLFVLFTFLNFSQWMFTLPVSYKTGFTRT